jgi:hypothetical protein
MRPTVAALAGRPDADLVLVDAVRDGQFIFDVRTHPAAHGRIIALRASKLLYSRAARTRYGYEQYVDSPARIAALLDRLGIRYIVLEDRLPTSSRPAGLDGPEDRSWDTPPRDMLRELVRDRSRFVEICRQSMGGGDPDWADVNLVTYRYTEPVARPAGSIAIPIPAMGRRFELRLGPTSRP